MEYVRFGRTGFMASRIGYGGATAGLKNYLSTFDPHNKEDRRKIIESIEKALELGINYFDTAPGYGDGQSEEMFGEALEGVNPDAIFLATKANFCSREHLCRSVEASLKRLKRDRVDLLQIHGDSYTYAVADDILRPGGMLEAMLELKNEGLIKYLGFTSEDNNPAVYRFIQCGSFDMLQLCYNFIFQHPYEPSRPFGSFYEAEKMDMGIATMRAPTSGTFQRWIEMVNPQNTFDYTRGLIQFVLSNPLVDVALIGMRSAERVKQNVEICNDLAGRIDISKVHTRYV